MTRLQRLTEGLKRELGEAKHPVYFVVKSTSIDVHNLTAAVAKKIRDQFASSFSGSLKVEIFLSGSPKSPSYVSLWQLKPGALEKASDELEKMGFQKVHSAPTPEKPAHSAAEYDPHRGHVVYGSWQTQNPFDPRMKTVEHEHSRLGLKVLKKIGSDRPSYVMLGHYHDKASADHAAKQAVDVVLHLDKQGESLFKSAGDYVVMSVTAVRAKDPHVLHDMFTKTGFKQFPEV